MPYRESIPGRESSHQLTDAWIRASGHALNSVVEANRAALAAFGLAGDRSGLDRSERRDAFGVETDESGVESGTDRVSEGGYAAEGADRLDWTSERTVESPDDLELGDVVTFTKSLDDEDIFAFARASGDTNPLHLSDEFAGRTRFGGRIAHGTLVSGVVSAALARLPGQVIYLSQETQYLNPVAPGDAVTATVEVTEVLGDGRYRLSTNVTSEDGEPVLEGEAVVLVDELADDAG